MFFEINLEIFCTVLTILCSLWLLGRYLLADEYVYIPQKKRHNWKSIKILNRALYCSMCEMMLPSNGQFCDYCGICADSSCIKKADQSLRCKDKVAKNSESIPHLWVKGNLPINCICMICDQDIDYHAEPGLYGYRCCWCQRAVHNECFVRAVENASDAEHCDYGAFKRMIIPPTNLVVIKARGSRKLKLTGIRPPILDGWKPLIVIANDKSGDNSSPEVISLFRSILHPLQVTELKSKGPQEALRWVAKVSPHQCRILVVGGDGTVGWILNTIFDMQIEPIPEVCILPIGTGNDLSRVLNWGSEPPGSLNPIEFLYKIETATPIKLDRWLIEFANRTTSRNPLKWSPHRSLFMYNYFSVGVDAQVALNFHKARESSLYMFSSRIINKALYLCFGTQQMVQPDCVGLEKQIELYLDGTKIDLPELQSVVCLNIDSWGAGVRLWEMSTDQSEEYTHSTSDGILEVLGIVSSFHIAQLQVGLNKPIRLGQAKVVKMIIKQTCPVQADGEPWIQIPAEINITLKGQAKMLKCAS